MDRFKDLREKFYNENKRKSVELIFLRQENRRLTEEIAEIKSKERVIPPIFLESKTEGNGLELDQSDINKMKDELRGSPTVMELFEKMILHQRNEYVKTACSNYISEEERVLSRAMIEAYYDIYAKWITFK